MEDGQEIALTEDPEEVSISLDDEAVTENGAMRSTGRDGLGAPVDGSSSSDGQVPEVIREIETKLGQAKSAVWKSLERKAIYIQCYFVTIACILGTGILGLPVTLSHSGLSPFLVSFIVGFFMQALLIYFFTDILQRAHACQIERHKAICSEEVNVPLQDMMSDESGEDGSGSESNPTERNIPASLGKPPTPNLHMLGSLFLQRGLRQAFDVVLLLQFVSILISYALAGSEAYAQVLNIKYLYVIPVFVWVLSLAIVFAQKFVQPFVSLLTLAKGGVLVATVVVTFGVGAIVSNEINNDFSYIGSPFLMGTVALGGVINIMPMLYARIEFDKTQIKCFMWAVLLGLVTCTVLNILWCWAVLDIVPQTDYCEVVSHVTDYDNSSGLMITTTYTLTPGMHDCLEDLSLEHSEEEGEIATVPLTKILQTDYPQYSWVAVLIQLFITISITVSYLTIGSALVHSFLGWLDAQMAWDQIDRHVNTPARSYSFLCSQKYCRPFLSLVVFIVIFIVAMLDPKGFVTMLDKISSLLLNTEAGLFVFLMIRKSRSEKYSHLTIPFPSSPYLYPFHFVMAAYFIYAVVYDIVASLIEILS
ncbi:uncharacterized protein LOC110981030 isoform X2 [Acanthaster planci]|uniref:Uncharacterized protein LOC110981030 isoform X2 n=1 Tax=Acanthaster planci TaxID=133434 RepID=A0A8B7YMI1_ACAPL|nr:uncharacterized protein LOC110981030 isoform X2 [Acanthaster planci]